eukprot:gene4310-3124_t
MWNDLISQLGKAIEDSLDVPDEENTSNSFQEVGAAFDLPLAGFDDGFAWDSSPQDVEQKQFSEDVKPQNQVKEQKSSALPELATGIDDNVAPCESSHNELKGDIVKSTPQNSDVGDEEDELCLQPVIETDSNLDENKDVATPNGAPSSSTPETTKNDPPSLSREQEALLKFQDQLAKEMNGNDQLKRENEKQRRELAELRTILADKTAEAKQVPLLAAKLSESKEKYEQLKSELQQRKDEIEQMQEELQESVEELMNVKNELQRSKEAERAAQECIDELEVLSERKSAQLGAIQTKMNELREENMNLVSQLTKLKEEASSVDTEIHQKLLDEKIRLEAEIERLASELQSSVIEYEKRIQHMDEEVFEATTRANDAEMRLEEMEHNSVYSLQTVRTDVESMQALLTQMSSMKASVEAQCDELRKENSRLRAQKKSDVQKLDDIIASQSSQIKELTKTNSSLKEQIDALEKEKTNLTKRVSAAEKEVGDLRQREWSLATQSQQMQPSEKNQEEHFDEKPSQRMSYSSRAANIYPIMPMPNDVRSNPKLENEVIRQSLQIKELRAELDSYNTLKRDHFDLKRKHEVLLVMYGEAQELIARLQEATQEKNRRVARHVRMSTVQPMTHLQMALAIKKSDGGSPHPGHLKELSDTLILLRHGERLDHVDRAWKGSDPPLSPAGKRQSLETALHFFSKQKDKQLENRLTGLLSMFMSSPFHRCLETVLIINIVGFSGSLPLYVNPLLSDWLQSKVFRSPPLLRGHYMYDASDSEIRFIADNSALREDLGAFLASASGDTELLSKYGVQHAVAEGWVGLLNSWCATHEKLPVWTSPNMCEQLYADIVVYSSERDSDVPTSFKRASKNSKSGAKEAGYSQCGVPHPETRRDLLQRCEEFIRSQYTRDPTLKPWNYYIPPLVMEAVYHEQKNSLPSYMKSLDNHTDKHKPLDSSSHALLPPMHVLCSTHADVVSGIVETACPKQRLPSKGISVPYCSMTVLRRRNNFYHMTNGFTKSFGDKNNSSLSVVRSSLPRTASYCTLINHLCIHNLGSITCETFVGQGTNNRGQLLNTFSVPTKPQGKTDHRKRKKSGARFLALRETEENKREICAECKACAPGKPDPQTKTWEQNQKKRQKHRKEPGTLTDTPAEGLKQAVGKSVSFVQGNLRNTGGVSGARRAPADEVWQHLWDMWLSASRRDQKNGHHTSFQVSVVEDYNNSNERRRTFAQECLKPHRLVNIVSCSGDSVSPRGDREGGVRRSAYQEQHKVSLDVLLSSVDDIVSQVYVAFDEDFTKLLLNALDRVTMCDTQDKRDRAKVVALDELLEVFGYQHYELLQCIMYRPREVFLRLLEEFCTLDNEDSPSGNKGNNNRGMTVRFTPSPEAAAPGRQPMSEGQKWLKRMQQRYRVLMRESEIDEMFKKDFSVSGSTMPQRATFKQKEGHIRVHIPPPELEILPMEQRVCIANALPAWTHPAFLTITHLNTIQTNIFSTAFHTSQNMLVCAPTGAGKTVCALLVMLRCIGNQMKNGVLDRDFKIVFVSPMKALASEMTDNFARRLAPFMIKVRELTGDMQLTKKEIIETQVIVTTPEKWDGITRKQSSNEELIRQVRLIVMDEIHLLNEDRGPVLEAIVARTLRLREASSDEYDVRLVGLSATLPNYKDVAHFLQVDLKEGLKVFGPEYRPVPLEQTFIALKGEKKRDADLNLLAYEEVRRSVRQGHQVLVFLFAAKNLPTGAQKKGQSLKGKDLASLFNQGFGVHHAGLTRFDRTTTEDLCRDGHIKVLCCTSTLAWGVNLPAHTVIIRGTQIYDPKRGGQVSMSALDVMQMFGRAGRPQFDTSGEGIIISDEKEVGHFLRLIANALPIESKMQSRLCDHLNAEVNAGTISSVAEGCSWLEYTYLWQRIRVNPMLYGLKVNSIRKDPELTAARYEMVLTAFQKLAKAGMVRFNEATGSVEATDLGRIASHYYLTHETIGEFNERMRKPDGTWLDSIDMGVAMTIVASANEFEQLRVRDEEVTTLLKAYISRLTVEAHSLAADMNHIIQNVPRIARALFEIELQRGHPMSTYVFLTLCKCMEHRCWNFEHPLMQFSLWSRRIGLTDAVWQHLNKRNPSMSMLQEMTAGEIGEMVHNRQAGKQIASLAASFPNFTVQSDVQPITRSILRVKVTIEASFTWRKEFSGNSEMLWLVVEDEDNNFIFHHESVNISRKEVESGTPHVVNFAVPIIPQYDVYCIRLYSDRWLGCREDFVFSIAHLHLPEDTEMTTKLLPLEPLSVSVLPEKYRVLYGKYNQFNAVQTQIFHAMFHTDENIFLGAPTGSGKTISAEMAVLRVFESYPGGKVVYIAPLKALVKERLRDWKDRFKSIGRSVVELSGDATPDMRAIAEADVLCTTPEKWDGISRSWQVRKYVTAVKLVVFDEIHMLGTDRGPILEVIVSRMRYIGWHLSTTIRLVGLSTAVSNPGDLSSWLGVEKKWAVYNFDPSVRPVPMTVHISGYPGKNYCPRMATMNKPTYNAICEKSPNKPVIVFVSSRRQTRLTGMALIGFLLMEGDTSKWVNMTVEELETNTTKLDDPYVKHCIQFGVGIHHAGLLEGDRTIVEKLFLSGKIQVLVATSTLAWGVNFPAHMVVVKGTEYYDAKTSSYVDFPITDVLQMIGRAGRPQYDTEGVAQVLCHEPKKSFYRKFLYDPFPVESALHRQLHVHINAEIVSGTITTRQEAVNYLTWTYLFRRISRNPAYYGLEDSSPKSITVFLSNLIKDILVDLEHCGCIEFPQDEDENSDALAYTVLGKICSYYYISHKTIYLFDTSLSERNGYVELLRLLCDAEEFAELPVRHNEDSLNMELSRKVPFAIESTEADSPHAKAFLLFQAHFEGAELPITDYYTDQKSAMDNAVRVIQAMVDVAANNGHLYTALRCMTLMQCLVQGRWWDSPTLLQLPHVTAAIASAAAERCGGLRHAAELANSPLSTLQSFQHVLEDPAFSLTPRQVFEAMEGVQALPLISVLLAVEPRTTDDEEAECAFLVTVTLERLSAAVKSVVAPKFSKAKDEQYWIAVGYERTGELVALKRVNRLQKTATTTLIIEWDEDWEEELSDPDAVSLSLFVVCDSYLGMDQTYPFTIKKPR